jgi:hypothetical protein
VTLSQSLGDRIHNEMVLLAPAGCALPESLSRRHDDRARHARWLEEMQRVRGSIYLADGALEPGQLTSDGRHVQHADYESWHVLAVNGNGEVQGCARYRHLTGDVGFEDLAVRDSWLAQSSQWGASLRSAVESEIVRARRQGKAFSEVGGWAIAPEKRCTTEALRVAMATYSLARLLGGCVGISTATERHRSSSILRRIGGSPLEYGGASLPSYYDPKYRCRMEVLRFDSSSPDASCSRLVDQLGSRMSAVSVMVAWDPAKSQQAVPSSPVPVPLPFSPRLGWVA